MQRGRLFDAKLIASARTELEGGWKDRRTLFGDSETRAAGEAMTTELWVRASYTTSGRYAADGHLQPEV
jgi:hypothetical protein